MWIKRIKNLDDYKLKRNGYYSWKHDKLLLSSSEKLGSGMNFGPLADLFRFHFQNRLSKNCTSIFFICQKTPQGRPLEVQRHPLLQARVIYQRSKHG